MKNKESATVAGASTDGDVPFPPVEDSHASPPDQQHPALEEIAPLRGILYRFEKEVAVFKDTPRTKPSKSHSEHRRLSESILAQVLLKLDAIEPQGNPEMKVKRRELVRETLNIRGVSTMPLPSNFLRQL